MIKLEDAEEVDNKQSVQQDKQNQDKHNSQQDKYANRQDRQNYQDKPYQDRRDKFNKSPKRDPELLMAFLHKNVILNIRSGKVLKGRLEAMSQFDLVLTIANRPVTVFKHAIDFAELDEVQTTVSETTKTKII